MISVQRKKEKVNKYKGLARALKNLKKVVKKEEPDCTIEEI